MFTYSFVYIKAFMSSARIQWPVNLRRLCISQTSAPFCTKWQAAPKSWHDNLRGLDIYSKTIIKCICASRSPVYKAGCSVPSSGQTFLSFHSGNQFCKTAAEGRGARSRLAAACDVTKKAVFHFKKTISCQSLSLLSDGHWL